VAVATAPVRPVSAWHFVRLKLRILGNGMRGQNWRIGLFILGVLAAVWFAGLGFLLSALPGLADNADAAMLVAALGGGVVVLGWVLLPLVFFGVDETIDPARFALLPLRRRTLVTGMLAAAAVGLPALATLVATAGLVLSAASLGGIGPALAEAVGVLIGLSVCVAGSRAVTSAFAAMLRSRRVRDLAAIMLAVAAALIGPIQIASLRAAEGTDWRSLLGAAEIVGWTPFGAAYTLGFDVAAGRVGAAAVKLLIALASLAVLLWWWSRTVESAMLGRANDGGPRARTGPARAAVDQLFPGGLRWAPRNRFGALAAREARYWWRDARRRANLITITVVGVFVPVFVNAGDRFLGVRNADDISPTKVAFSLVFVGALASVTLVNQFGFDGSAYAANVVAGVPGRAELAARTVGFSLYVIPTLTIISVALVALLGKPEWFGVAAGAVAASYGAGLAVCLLISILGAYSLPESSNPFALGSGTSLAKGLLSFGAMIATSALGVPFIIATAFLGDVWLWLALPVGLAYGGAAAVLGTYIAGDVLDHRMPELLQTVTPRR
jgi:ABC-2 type transport system permease protein